MMTKRSLLMALLMTLLLALNISAQTEDKDDRLDDRMKELQKELRLTDDQTEQLRHIFEEARPPRAEDAGTDERRDERQRGDRGGRRGEMVEKIQSVLTEEQWQKYQEYERSRRMASQLEMLTEALNLTEKQVVQVETVLDYFQGRMEELFSEGYSDQQDRRKAMEKLREAQDKEIREILTDEQIDLYEDYQEQRREQMRNRRPGGRGRPDGGF